jgi:hypothetical protein
MMTTALPSSNHRMGFQGPLWQQRMNMMRLTAAAGDQKDYRHHRHRWREVEGVMEVEGMMIGV